MTTAGRLRLAEQCRVVVDNDWAGDPDGLVALAHHLLSPTNRVVAVTGSFLNPAFGPLGSPASAAIVTEARHDDELPLVVVCAGPLTNVAAALDEAPDLAARMTLVWIGGALAADADEYNRDTGPAAAEFVFAQDGLSIRQSPAGDLPAVRVLGRRAGARPRRQRPARAVALVALHRAAAARLDPARRGRSLGDSPPVLITALSDESSRYEETGSLRVSTDVDVRLLFGDLLARLRAHG
jgi:purine nucleosidase